MTLSDRIRHFFHVVSNVRPIIWIGLYVALTPVFALIYWALPDGQFRIPDGAGTDFGSWLYYSIVTITTLGFGDYTPAHGWAQAVTALEVMCGLIILGFFLNAVGSMKSEIDVESEIEKQKRVHDANEKGKLLRNIPSLLHNINLFLTYCYANTTPIGKRKEIGTYNPDFSIEDMKDIYRHSGLESDLSNRPAVERLMRAAENTSLALDSLQTRIDLSQWPDLLENCFSFVANCQMYSSEDIPSEEQVQGKSSETHHPLAELAQFIRKNALIARNIEAELTAISSAKQDS